MIWPIFWNPCSDRSQIHLSTQIDHNIEQIFWSKKWGIAKVQRSDQASAILDSWEVHHWRLHPFLTMGCKVSRPPCRSWILKWDKFSKAYLMSTRKADRFQRRMMSHLLEISWMCCSALLKKMALDTFLITQFKLLWWLASFCSTLLSYHLL